MLQTFPANIVGAITCAALSYWLVEKPFLRLKRCFQAEAVKGRSAGESQIPDAAGPGNAVQEPA